jgi:hypothetical protein
MKDDFSSLHEVSNPMKKFYSLRGDSSPSKSGPIFLNENKQNTPALSSGKI